MKTKVPVDEMLILIFLSIFSHYILVISLHFFIHFTGGNFLLNSK